MKLEPLKDISSTGKERPWRKKKLLNLKLAELYENIDFKKAIRLRDCATHLTFQQFEDGTKKIKRINSCNVRLCPLCSWRRSLKVHHHMNMIMHEIEKEKEYGYLVLTLTIRNVLPDELNDAITNMMQGFKDLMANKQVKKIAKGWYRGLEITYNEQDNTYHPHFHVVIAVNKSYFKKADYLNKQQWTELWKNSMNLSYIPVVNVKRVKGNTTEAISNIARYTVKYSDYIRQDNLELSEEIVRVLDKALHKRRLIAYGGIFKQVHRRLRLDEEENKANSKTDEDDNAVRISYAWNVGLRNYYIEP